MLRPVRERAAELPPTQRDALDAAFGVMQEIAPEHYRIAMASLDLVRGCRRTDSPASTTRQPRPYSTRRLRSFSDLTRQRERGARQCSTARPTADRRTVARSTSAPAAASGGSSSPAAAGRSPASTTSRGPCGAPARASARRASRSSSCAATSRRCARPGSAPATGCCSTPELPTGRSRRRPGGRARGKCLVRFGLTDPGRVAVQHAAAVVVPVGGKVHVGISIVMASGSADRASRTSSETPAYPRTCRRSGSAR